ncbi:MAG: glycerol-3-phosphate acyltransferase [Desulfobacteraceae bacterium]|nr:glycerol-3-phosphate acyltransferase [Desulfobacteraceae bacterium]
MPRTTDNFWTILKQNLRRFIDRRIDGTHDHYLYHQPAGTGRFSFWLLRKFYAGILIKTEETDILKKLPDDAIIVYTTKYKSFFEYLFYHTRLHQDKLPTPEWGFGYPTYWWQPVSKLWKVPLAKLDHLYQHRSLPDPYQSGFMRDFFLNGSTALLSLIEKKGFYHRFVKSKEDPLSYLIKIQKTIDRPIYLVPLLMFFGKSPDPSIPSIVDIIFGSLQRPGKFRKIVTLFKSPGRVFVEISEPLNLRQFLDQPDIMQRSDEYRSLMLRRHLVLKHNRHRQSITGPVLKTNEELKESILASERMRQFMEQHAKNRKEPIHEIRKQADTYIDEIAAKYNFFFIRIMSGIVSWITNTMFDGAVIDREGLQKVKTMSQKGPLVLIPCHKSHIDYLILSYVLYKNNMPCPHIAAGKNLSFWPLGPIFRAGGAFFIRRTFRGAVLYAKVFSEYIHKLLDEGFNILQFIEGGRSRTGKLLMPKLGLLSILINAYRNGACDDMIFVPVYIGYDQVLEESAYLHEIEGGKKEPENLSQVIKARRFLKKRYGKIYINFHDPISSNELLDNSETPPEQMSTKQVNAFIRNLGWRVIRAIDSETVVTPHSIMAAALLNCPKDRFAHQDLMSIFDTYLNFLHSRDALLSDTLVMDPTTAAEQAINSYQQRKFIDTIKSNKSNTESADLLSINTGRRPALEYYKNNCIAYFIPAALTALTILEKDAFQFSASDLHNRYTFLQDLFKYEFAFDVERTPESIIRKTIKYFIDDAILMPHPTLPDTYNITSSGLRKLNLYARFLKTYFESYRVVLNFYQQHVKTGIVPKDRLKKIQALGNRMYKRGEIELKESLSKVNYDNAVTFFSSQRIRGSEDEDKIKRFSDAIKTYLDLLD